MPHSLSVRLQPLLRCLQAIANDANAMPRKNGTLPKERPRFAWWAAQKLAFACLSTIRRHCCSRIFLRLNDSSIPPVKLQIDPWQLPQFSLRQVAKLALPGWPELCTACARSQSFPN